MKKLSRRHVLRGAGAVVALPYLESLAGAAPAAADTPKRCAFIYFPNGVNTLTWQLQEAGPDYRMTEPLKALERHRRHITPISGLHHPHGIGQAHECDKIWLTGAKVSQEGGAFRNTISADQLVAEETGKHTRFASLELAITGKTLAWSRDGIPLPAERRPVQVFERLFGEEKGGKEAARRRLDRRGSVLDVILDDARGVRKRIDADDRSKLDEYLHSVREVELRSERAESWLDVPKPRIDPATKSRLARTIPKEQAGEYYRTLYELMALAFQTDMTRVITYMTGDEGNGIAIPEIGIPQTRHELSHHNGDPEQLRRLSQTDVFLAEQFGWFLDRLASIKEGGGTLLDRTMVLYGSGMCYGHSHGNANLPLILAGGRALGLKHGSHVDFNLPKVGKYDLTKVGSHYRLCSRPVDTDARLNNLLLTMIRQMGVKAESFGDSVRPLTEVLA